MIFFYMSRSPSSDVARGDIEYFWPVEILFLYFLRLFFFREDVEGHHPVGNML